MTDPSKPLIVPAPPTNPETQAYWAAAGEGRLAIGYCPACEHWHFYPRSICPLCHTPGAELRTSAGKGAVYSVSAMLRGTPEPYAIAYVQLDEGPRMLSNIVECAPLDVRIGQRVEVTFVAASDGQAVPMFRPAPV